MIKDLCHVMNCEEPATDIQWCHGLGVCIQVCVIHAFDTLAADAVLDIGRADGDHKRNAVLYHEATLQ